MAGDNGRIMDWIPLSFLAFKLLVFGTCMFYAIKWHRDRARQEQDKEKENE